MLLDGELSGIGGAQARLKLSRPGSADKERPLGAAQTLAQAIGNVLDAVAEFAVDAVGYRIVHPGPKRNEHQKITRELLHDLEEAIAFAPLHDPAAIKVIEETMLRFPAAAHFACFDTVFHKTMPPEATTYAIPSRYREQGVRRYGFHGLSCESVVCQMRRKGALPKRMVIAHLGSGCSVTALRDGESVDTTMGMTPTGGVVMGTRPGDLDPGVLLYLLRQQTEADPATALEATMNRESGMMALSELPNDMRAVRQAAAAGDAKATLTIKVFTRSIRKAIGSYAWLLGGLDAIVFTGGIGEHDAETRTEVLSDLEGIGVALNESLNRNNSRSGHEIHAAGSRTKVFIIPAQEDLMIARHVSCMAGSQPTG